MWLKTRRFSYLVVHENQMFKNRIKTQIEEWATWTSRAYVLPSTTADLLITSAVWWDNTQADLDGCFDLWGLVDKPLQQLMQLPRCPFTHVDYKYMYRKCRASSSRTAGSTHYSVNVLCKITSILALGVAFWRPALNVWFWARCSRNNLKPTCPPIGSNVLMWKKGLQCHTVRRGLSLKEQLSELVQRFLSSQLREM